MEAHRQKRDAAVCDMGEMVSYPGRAPECPASRDAVRRLRRSASIRLLRYLSLVACPLTPSGTLGPTWKAPIVKHEVPALDRRRNANPQWGEKIENGYVQEYIASNSKAAAAT